MPICPYYGYQFLYKFYKENITPVIIDSLSSDNNTKPPELSYKRQPGIPTTKRIKKKSKKNQNPNETSTNITSINASNEANNSNGNSNNSKKHRHRQNGVISVMKVLIISIFCIEYITIFRIE